MRLFKIMHLIAVCAY